MKKILLALGLLASSAHAVNPIISYVQISTGATQSGGPNTQTATVSNSLNLPFVNGVQCLHSVNGVVTGTGLDCGTGGGGGVAGGGTINAGQQFSLPFYSVAGSSNALSAASGFSWYGSSAQINGGLISNGNIGLNPIAGPGSQGSSLYFTASDGSTMGFALGPFGFSNYLILSALNGIEINGGQHFSHVVDLAVRAGDQSTTSGQYGSLAVVTPSTGSLVPDHYLGFSSTGPLNADSIWSLPFKDGTTGQALLTNGTHNLFFGTVSGGGGSGGSSIYPATATPTFPFGANATSITTPQITTTGPLVETFAGGLVTSSLILKSASTGFDAYDQITDAGPLQLRSTNGGLSSRFGVGATFNGATANGWTIENFSNTTNPTGLNINTDGTDTVARFINFEGNAGGDFTSGFIYYTPSLSLFQSNRSWSFSYGVSASTINATAFNASTSSVTVTGAGGFQIISSSAGQFGFNENTAATFNTSGSNIDAMYADSSSHTLVMNNNSRGDYVVAGTSTTNVSGNVPVWCGMGALCDSGSVLSKAVITASPQFQVPYFSSAGSSQTIAGAPNVTNTGSTFTLTSVYTMTTTNVTTSTLTGIYFDVSASSMNVGFATFTSTISIAASNGPRIISISTSAAGPYAVDVSSTNHLNFQDQNSSPTLTSCGSGPTYFGSDNALTVTPGSAATACTITFGTPYTNTPVCNVTPQTLSLVNALSYTVTNRAVTLSQTSLTEKIDIRCTGRD